MQPDSPYQPPATLEPAPTRAPHSNIGMSKLQVLLSVKGRIPRRTYWLWMFVSLVGFLIPFSLLAPLLDSEGTKEMIGIVLVIPLILAFLWINVALRIKRWHDHDKSWGWLLIGLIPYIGELLSFIYLGCSRGTIGHNRYGDDPT